MSFHQYLLANGNLNAHIELITNPCMLTVYMCIIMAACTEDIEDSATGSRYGCLEEDIQY